jgi:ribosomal protein RSM22 (predicted rRNA methylase)
MKELPLHDEYEAAVIAGKMAPVFDTEMISSSEPRSRAGLEEALRLEAYSWPRLIFPPLKKSGHIILDGCTAEGESSPWT